MNGLSTLRRVQESSEQAEGFSWMNVVILKKVGKKEATADKNSAEVGSVNLICINMQP